MSSVKEVQSVHNACRVVDAVATLQPIGVSDLARATGIDKSGVHRLAVTLHGAGWLERTDDGRWRVAPGIAGVLAEAAGASLIDRVRPLLEGARDATGETAMLVVAEGRRLRVAAVVESRHNLRVTASVGVAIPAASSAALRCIAAHMDADELERWREVDPALTAATVGEVRERGWSINDAEVIPESRAVGVAVCSPLGRPLGALVVFGPSSRFTADLLTAHGRALAGLVRDHHSRSESAA